MKNIRYIVVHCTATPPTASPEDVKSNWKQKQAHHILQANPFVIKRDGEIVRFYHTNKKEVIENISLPPVDECIHIAYIGGIDREGNTADNKTQRQEDALFDKLVELSDKYPDSKIIGNDEFTGVKSISPSFDVKAWLTNYKPDFLELDYENELAA